MADINSKDTSNFQTVTGTKENDNIHLGAGHGRLEVFRGGSDNVTVGNGAFYSMKSMMDDSLSDKTRDHFKFEVKEGQKEVAFYIEGTDCFYSAVIDVKSQQFVSAVRSDKSSGYFVNNKFVADTASEMGELLHPIGSKEAEIAAGQIDRLIALGQSKEIAQKLAESGALVQKAEADAGNPNLGVNGKGAVDKKAEIATK